MRKLRFVTAFVAALVVAAPVAFADPGQNGPPGPEGNPNYGTTPAPQGPPTTSPGNSANNPHGGAPGITGQAPQTPASSSAGSSNGGGNGGANASAGTPAPQAATPTAPPAATPPVTPGEPQGPPADVPRGNGYGPGGNPAAQGGRSNAQGPDGRITICHATGSETNPFVEITISVNGLNGHGDHQDDEDMIPAPGGACELGAPAAGAFAPWGGASEPAANPAVDEDEMTSGTDEPTGGVLDESEFSPLDADQAVLASFEDDENTPGVDGSVAAGGTGDASRGGELPFTGVLLSGLLLTGMLMLASGLGLRHGWASRFSGK